MIYLVKYLGYEYCQGTKDTFTQFALVYSGSFKGATLKILDKHPEATNFENCTIGLDGFDGIQLR